MRRREKAVRGIGLWAAAALVLMVIGSIGTGIVPTEYFGVVERFSVFAAVGFNAVLGVYLFHGFKKPEGLNMDNMAQGIQYFAPDFQRTQEEALTG